MVFNKHTREMHTSLAEAGKLLDGLASEHDHLWPRDAWPAMHFDRPLSVGAVGGHGPIRYIVESYEPGRSISFRFTAPDGVEGTHGFDVQEITPGVVRLRHVLSIQTKRMARLSWPLMIRWLHDALLEDALDRAEAYLTSQLPHQRLWPFWVRFLRDVSGRRGKKRPN